MRRLLALAIVTVTLSVDGHLMSRGHATLRIAPDRGYFVAHLTFSPVDLGLKADDIQALVRAVPTLIQLRTTADLIGLSDVLLMPEALETAGEAQSFTILGSFPYGVEQIPVALIINSLLRGAPIEVRTTCVRGDQQFLSAYGPETELALEQCGSPVLMVD